MYKVKSIQDYIFGYVSGMVFMYVLINWLRVMGFSR